MSTPLNILVVEDHDVLRLATVRWLSEQGHYVQGVASAEELGDCLARDQSDVYIIDLNLPGEDGLSLSRRLREASPLVGIVMTTARSKIQDRVDGYKSGADIYLPKPVEPEELLAAIESLGQRLRILQAASPASASLHVETCVLHGPSGTAQLTYSETALLASMVSSQDEFMPRSAVAASLGLVNGPNTEAVLNVRLSQLRKKIQQTGVDGPVIQSLRGRGYRLSSELVLS